MDFIVYTSSWGRRCCCSWSSRVRLAPPLVIRWSSATPRPRSVRCWLYPRNAPGRKTCFRSGQARCRCWYCLGDQPASGGEASCSSFFIWSCFFYLLCVTFLRYRPQRLFQCSVSHFHACPQRLTTVDQTKVNASCPNCLAAHKDL